MKVVGMLGRGAPSQGRARRDRPLYKRILDDEDFRATLGEFYLRKVYERLRQGDEAPTETDRAG